MLLLRPPPAVTPVERRPMLSTILFEINVLMLLSQAPYSTKTHGFFTGRVFVLCNLPAPIQVLKLFFGRQFAAALRSPRKTSEQRQHGWKRWPAFFFPFFCCQGFTHLSFVCIFKILCTQIPAIEVMFGGWHLISFCPLAVCWLSHFSANHFLLCPCSGAMNGPDLSCENTHDHA